MRDFGLWPLIFDTENFLSIDLYNISLISFHIWLLAGGILSRGFACIWLSGRESELLDLWYSGVEKSLPSLCCTQVDDMEGRGLPLWCSNLAEFLPSDLWLNAWVCTGLSLSLVPLLDDSPSHLTVAYLSTLACWPTNLERVWGPPRAVGGLVNPGEAHPACSFFLFVIIVGVAVLPAVAFFHAVSWLSSVTGLTLSQRSTPAVRKRGR